jgi:hypothetical protein
VPEVSVAMEMQVAVERGADPVELAIASKDAPSTSLHQQALKVLDAQVSEADGAKQPLEERWVATTFGRVRICRYRVKSPEGNFHPLDRTLGLCQAEASPALREAVCDLATRLTVWTDGRGRVPADRRVLLRARSPAGGAAEGAWIRTEEGELVTSVFDPQEGAIGTQPCPRARGGGGRRHLPSGPERGR